jgi:hypothetical protein
MIPARVIPVSLEHAFLGSGRERSVRDAALAALTVTEVASRQ